MNKATTIRLPNKLKDEMHIYAKEQGMTFNSIVIQACKAYMKENAPPNTKA